ncbi:MAG: (2Fe-2S)-binding protein [Acidimicrobiia bacterium]|nr:(2Fe-2S)-binding protein [Acidimicrobiia bacterium]MDX2467529.1 (2Fe-2S)-binding protein [Acidimicrobiia bacterium]
MIVSFKVNGEDRVADVAGSESLLQVLREELGLPGSKNACEQGECGSCSVVLDGAVVTSCLVMAADCEGSEVTTVEGIGSERELHAVQQALIDHGAVQCGFCTPGFVVTAAHMFEQNPHPTTDEIKESLSGNICRCTGYGAILRSLEALAGETP